MPIIKLNTHKNKIAIKLATLDMYDNYFTGCGNMQDFARNWDSKHSIHGASSKVLAIFPWC